MSRKHTYSYKTHRSDVLLSRMMTAFVLLIASVFTLLSLRNWLDTTAAVDSYAVYIKVVKLTPILPIILTALSVLLFVKRRRNGVDEKLKTFSSAFLISVSLVLLVITLLISKYLFMGYVPAIVFVILVSLLYFISVCFPGPYLVTTVFNALGAFTIYVLHLVSPIDNPVMHYALRTVAVLVALLFILLMYKARKNGGECFGIKILNPDKIGFPVFIAAALFVCFNVLGAFDIGSYVIYDTVIALETIIFALYYAIKTLK